MLLVVRVEVVNGGEGDFFTGFLSIEEMLNFASILFSKKSIASSFDLKLDDN